MWDMILRKGDMIALEVDLRSNDRRKRTLHFFVDNIQKKPFFSGLPVSVEFVVYLFSYFFNVVTILIYICVYIYVLLNIHYLLLF